MRRRLAMVGRRLRPSRQPWRSCGPPPSAPLLPPLAALVLARRLGSTTATATITTTVKPKKTLVQQRQLLLEGLFPALASLEYGRIFALLKEQPPPPSSSRAATAQAAVAAVVGSPLLKPLSMQLYKAAAQALTREGLECEALALLAAGRRQGHLSEAATRRAHDGILRALSVDSLKDDEARYVSVMEAVGRAKEGYVPLLEALGKRGDSAAEQMIFRLLFERLGPDASLTAAKKGVVYGLGLKYLVEGGRFDAERLLVLKDEMRARGVQLDVVHVALFARGLAAQGRVEECMGLLHEHEAQVTPRVVSDALHGLARHQQQQQQQQQPSEQRLWEAAIRFLSLLESTCMGPERGTITTAIVVCGRAGHWPLALRLLDEGLWWEGMVADGKAQQQQAVFAGPRSRDKSHRPLLTAAIEVFPPAIRDGVGDGEQDVCLLRLFVPKIYKQGMAAGLYTWKRTVEGEGGGRLQPARPFVIDLHDHSIRMALYGALPDALHSLSLLAQDQGGQQQSPFPKEVHIVTGHGRNREQGPVHRKVGVLYPRVREWLAGHFSPSDKGAVFDVSLGCLGVDGKALRRALPALLASVS